MCVSALDIWYASMNGYRLLIRAGAIPMSIDEQIEMDKKYQIIATISALVIDFTKTLVIMGVLIYDHWTYSIIVENWRYYLCCKKPKKDKHKKQDRNLFKYFSASLTIEIIYTVLNAVTQ